MRRVAITGLGAVTPVGNDLQSSWDSLVAGRSGVDVIRAFDATDFPVNIAAEVKEFDAAQVMSAKEVRRTSHDVHFAVAAAMEAAADAELVVDKPSRTGVVIGSVMGGLPYTLQQQRILEERGWERVSPHWLPNTLVDTSTSHVATLLGARGINYSTESACATGTHAIGEAAAAIARDQADVVLAGATESSMVPIILAGFCAMRALVDGRDDPAGASRPFDKGRDGLVMGEAAAVLVLEELEHAKARGARIYAELLGYGISSDASHMTEPDPTGENPARAITMALGDAGRSPDDVDYVNAHATSTPVGDTAEARVLHRVFGERVMEVPVSSTKSMTGHMLGAAGATEAVVCVLAITRGFLPPTINLDDPDPSCPLDHIPNVPRAATPRVTISNGFGFGGHNACLVIEAYSE
jgi:3-oxoacyl-[acyl-carrier-protein] synthase II